MNFNLVTIDNLPSAYGAGILTSQLHDFLPLP
jgi:hypothetical protein